MASFNIEKELKKFSGNEIFGKQILGNDLAFFGKTLRNPRLQLAFSLGWHLAKNTYQENDYYTLVPPPHYSCSKNTWAGIYEKLEIDGVVISYPDWYLDNDVLMTGTRKSRDLTGVKITK